MNDINNEKELLQDYLEELNDDLSASEDVRDQANEEYRFTQVAGGHWEDWLEVDYVDRAKMQMNHTSDFLRRNYSTWTNNRQAVNYSPADDATSDETADLLDGLIRRDTQRKGGQSAIDTAVFEAMACGFGAIVLNTDYEDAGDPDNDYQNIVFSEQPCAYSTVIFDSSATDAAKQDARRCTILTPYSQKEFKRLFPGKNTTSVEPRDRSAFNWNDDGKLFTATRYEIDEERIHLETFSNPKSGDVVRINRKDVDQDELAYFGYEFLRSRKVTKQSAFKIVHSGNEILEARKRVVGQHIPVIPFYGLRSYVDGKENYRGIIREKMDQQRGLNMTYSLLMESAAHADEQKPVFHPDQMVNADVRNSWAKNMHQNAYALAGEYTDEAGNTHLGATGMTPGSKMSDALNSAIQMSAESLRQSTGGAPQDTLDPNSSGKAINAIFAREDQNVAMVFDNIDKSIKRVGTVYEGMATEVYGGKQNMGRSVRVVTEQGDTKPVTLVTPSAGSNGVVTSNNVADGKFEVVVGVSKNYQTEQEETFEKMKDLASSLDPQDPLRAQILRMMALAMDSPGLQPLQDHIKRELLASGILEPQSDEDKQYVAQLQQNQQPDANQEYLLAEAEKARSMLQVNEASTAQKAADAVKKAAEAEQIKLESRRLVNTPLAQ